ncbi:hypothetical protein D9M70_564460 [compost metagenome]
MGAFEGFGDQRVHQHAEHRASREAQGEGQPVWRQIGEQPRPGHGRQSGQQGDDAPEAEHQSAAAFFLAQPGGAGEPLRQVGKEDRHQHQHADLAATQQPQPQAK